jgi:hypothetical protein
MRLANMPLEVLSERLGHASIETTKIYTRPAELARCTPAGHALATASPIVILALYKPRHNPGFVAATPAPTQRKELRRGLCCTRPVLHD